MLMLTDHLNTKSKLDHSTIVTLVKNISSEADSKYIESQLKRAIDFKQLTITHLGEQIVNYQQKQPVFGDEWLSPGAQRVESNDLNLIVNYAVNYKESIIFVYQLIIAFTVLSLVFILIASYINHIRTKSVLNLFTNELKKQISDVLDPSKLDTSKTGLNSIVVPELKEGLNEIQSFILSQQENSTELEKQAFIEPITQLANRNAFVQYYEDNISSGEKVGFGTLIITRCSELQTINQMHGYHEGDQYICAVANILKEEIRNYTNATLYRLNSSDFASLIPNIKLKEAEKFTQILTDKFNKYQQASDIDSVAYSGLVYFDKDKPLGELLAMADTGISVAQTQQVNSWYAQKEDDTLSSGSSNYGNQNWRQEIDSVLENQRVHLLVQNIQPSKRVTKMYGEVLARFKNANDEILPTASFIAMAEKLDKIVAIDRLIIETTINEISSKNYVDQSFGINVSSRTIQDEHFLIWLERRLLREPNIAPKLIFEITEYGLQQNIRASKRFIDMLHRVGSRITVERFGVGLTSFKFFRELKPDFIKMDSTYTRDIDDDKNNQYFLRLMIDLAHRLSINVLAESVESQEEKHTLERLFIDGYQGFYVGKPSPI